MSFCRITGKSRALPKPNYFPLLPPISPKDAKRFCKITGKAYGLPSHHYIPVILTTLSQKKKCKITNVAGELGPHHYIPDIAYGKRKHIVLADYRYVFPTFNETDDQQKVLIDLLNSKNIADEGRFVYKVDERKCSLVFPARLEAAVRDGDVKDVMLAKNCDSVLLKMRQGKNVSVDLLEYEEDFEELYEGEGPRQEVILELEKEEALQKRRKSKRLDGLLGRARIFEDKERFEEEQMEEYEDQLVRSAKRKKLEQMKNASSYYKVNTYVKTNLLEARKSLHLESADYQDLVKPVIESWDWDTYEKEVVHKNYTAVSNQIPNPCKLQPLVVKSKNYDVPDELIENTTGFDAIPCIGPLTPILEVPDKEILAGIREMSNEQMEPLLNLQDKILEEPDLMQAIPMPEEIPSILKHIKKGVPDEIANVPGLTVDINAARKVFLTGQQVQTPNGEVFVPGQTVSTPQGAVYVAGLTVNTPTGPSFIPGHVLTPKGDTTSPPIFMAGQIVEETFVPGQTFNVGSSSRFVEGQTVLTPDGLKFVPGVINEETGTFVVGQKLQTPDGLKFIPGQTATLEDGPKFVAGQTTHSTEKGWEFVPGQVVKNNDIDEFVPGKTVITQEGSKFVPGQYVEEVFIPGVTMDTNMGPEFVPGLNVETKQGPKFIEGQVVMSKQGQIFMPGKTIINDQGMIEFAVAKTVSDVVFNEPTVTGYVIDANSGEVSNQCLSVFGYMVQTKNGIEFYPEKIDIDHLPSGKRVPGKLIKQDTDTKFVPGIMENGGFIPGQVVWTEKGEQFIPGQVIETSEGLKFVPGQVIETKTGSKFVPGQTVETPEGPRFVPGQIVQTKAGPTFIPGQVIYTEEEGERFVPGQVVDTEDGPRFVPGRVIESGDKVTFIPGQVIETSEGLKFVAPDLTDNEDGEQQFSVQSFLVSPEELTLLKPSHTWTQSSSKGELSIDSKMLRQLSEAGMTIGRQIEASAVDIVLQSTRNIQSVRQLIENLGIEPQHSETFLQFFQEIEKISSELIRHKQHSEQLGAPITNGIITNGYHHKDQNGNLKMDQKEQLIETLLATILSVIQSTANGTRRMSLKNGKGVSLSIFEMICQAFEENAADIDIQAVDDFLRSATLRDSVLKSIEKTVATFITEGSKQQVLHTLITKNIHNEGELISKIASIIDDEDLNQAFLIITDQDPRVLYKILNLVRDNPMSAKCDESVADILQGAIISAVKELSEGEIRLMFTEDRDERAIHALLFESCALSKALGLNDYVAIFDDVLNGTRSVAAVFENPELIEVVKRTLIINKLAQQDPELQYSLQLLAKNPYEARKDPNVRKLIRQSGVVTIIPEEKPQLVDSNDVPLSFFSTDNQLAMEDFLLRRQKKNKGAFLIVKEGLQAVVPRESSRDVLTGKCAYTVLDENGIRHFEPLHVFSALKLNTPSMAHRFSIYSCDFASDDVDVENHNYATSSCSSLSGGSGDLKVTTRVQNGPMMNGTSRHMNGNSKYMNGYHNDDDKENIPTMENTELLANRRKIRALVEEGKVNTNNQKSQNFLQRVKRELNIN